MKKYGSAKRALGLGKRTILALAAGSLICAMGVGIAIAADTPEKEASGATNVVAFHETMGLSFDSMVEPIAADMTASEIATNTVGTREFCLSCHDWDAIVDTTLLPGDVTVYNKQGLYNVHNNHYGEANCSECHTVNEGEAATLGCVSCHYLDLPEGWEGFY